MMPLCSRPLQLIDHVVWHARRALTVHDLADDAGRKAVCTGAPNRPRCAHPSPAFCDRKFEIVTPTSRMPLGGGKTDRIRPRASRAK
jgi:hypothetical protein